jgi:hypothetical protein
MSITSPNELYAETRKVMRLKQYRQIAGRSNRDNTCVMRYETSYVLRAMYLLRNLRFVLLVAKNSVGFKCEKCRL